MAVMAPERNRTDEHLDALANRMDEGFRELRAEMGALRAEMRTEMGALRTEVGAVRTEVGAVRAERVEVRKEIGEVREGLGEVKAEIKGVTRTMQVCFGLIGAVLTGILGLIAALLAVQL